MTTVQRLESLCLLSTVAIGSLALVACAGDDGADPEGADTMSDSGGESTGGETPMNPATTADPTTGSATTGDSTTGDSTTGEPGGTEESTGAPVEDSGSSGGDEAPSLAGDWTSPCFDVGDGTFAVLDFALSDEDWAVDYQVYGDDVCSFALVTVHIEGPYELEAPSAVVDGAWDGVFAFDAKTITPHAQPLVDALDGAGCGTDTWEIDVGQSVAEEGCAAFGQYPLADCAADYDIVSRDGDTMFFGSRPADNDMCTPERRPVELSPLPLALQ